MMKRHFLVLLLWCVACGQSLANSDARFDQMVEHHRAMLLLVSKSPARDPFSEGIFAARNAYAANREIEEQLVETAQTEAGQDRVSTVSHDLLRYLNQSPGLHDADWLAFHDLMDDLSAIEAAKPLTGTATTEWQAVHARYGTIYARYRNDYGKSLGELTRRGESYETWQAYMDFLSATYTYDGLLKRYGQEKRVLQAELTRGDNPVKKDQLTQDKPKTVWGYDLPEKTVVLTFDDGPHFKNTPAILDILKQYQVNGYFFSVGKNLGTRERDQVVLGRNEAISMRIKNEGHILANHSYSHAVLTKLDQAQRAEEIGKTNSLIAKVTGVSNTLFRPPYGSKDKALDEMAMKDGMISVMWNIDSMDWADPIPESIVDRTVRELDKYKKGILLFHDIHKQTVQALPALLDALQKGGYRVVSLDGRPFHENTTGEPVVTESDDTSLYGNSWAVVIGINQYQAWPKLEYAVNDAKEVANTLRDKLGFPQENIITLFDAEATSERITEVLGYELANTSKIKPEDRVFVFFAGHGMTRNLPNGKSLGYIIPVDAAADKFQNRAISMTQLGDFSAMIPAKHVYFVMDSCYSGLALTRAGVTAGQSLNYVNEITTRKARQILTAGGADQEVADGGPGGHSIFTWTLLQGLAGLADTDNNSYVTASELGTYVAPVVSSYSSQTPAFGNLLGGEGGDFVFKVDAQAIAEMNNKLVDDAKRIEEELTSLRKNTNDQVRRRLELQLELDKAQQEQAASQSSTHAAPDTVAAVVSDNTAANRGQPLPTPASDTQTISNLPDGDTINSERTKQAKRLNASAMEYFKEKKYKEARDELAEAVQLNPYNQTIVNNYGYVLDQTGENEEALKWYYRTVELNPRRTAVYMNLGDIMVELGRPQEAVPYYERYLHLYPSYKDADNLRARIEQYR